MGLGRDTTITWYGHACVEVRTPGGKVDPHRPVVRQPALAQVGRFRRSLRHPARDPRARRPHGRGGRARQPAQAGVAVHPRDEPVAGPPAGRRRRRGHRHEQGRDGRGRRHQGHDDRRRPLRRATGTRPARCPLYLGEPAGFVVELENGFRFYHAGDTTVFGDIYFTAFSTSDCIARRYLYFFQFRRNLNCFRAVWFRSEPSRCRDSLDDRHLLLERDQGLVGTVERRAKQRGQASNGLFCTDRIVGYERTDGVERVEEEVWMDAGFEPTKARFGLQLASALFGHLFFVEFVFGLAETFAQRSVKECSRAEDYRKEHTKAHVEVVVVPERLQRSTVQ